MSQEKLQLIEIPQEYDRAVEIAWNRARKMCYMNFSGSLLEAIKPMIISIYMQGLVDGYDVRIQEEDKLDAPRD